ncbi:hypothetical protein LZ023_14445 [Pseudomonas silvicola]|nr:hypothetical protein LZ023_14445 [Pseudomonas silvicola]
MAINLNALGSKLSRYRDQLAMSQEEVSAAALIPLERLRSIESESLSPRVMRYSSWLIFTAVISSFSFQMNR